MKTLTIAAAGLFLLVPALVDIAIAADPFLVRDINPGLADSLPSELININGTLYFEDYTNDTGCELWQTDGTPGSAVIVKDLNPGSSGSNPDYLTDLNGRLLFSADDGTYGTELWIHAVDTRRLLLRPGDTGRPG